MLDIKAYASGSSGNCYAVSNGKVMVMLDCGLPLRQLLKVTGYRLPNACLITHEHGDHSKGARDLARRGVDIYMTEGTAQEVFGQERGHRVHVLATGQSYNILGLTVSPFETEHDARDPCGFLIDDPDDRVLYATDTYYLKYRFPGMTKIMIECNHSYEILHERVAAGYLDKRLADRLVKSHFSIENLLAFFRANDLSAVKEIWLIHLSKDNANRETFRQAVERETGKMGFVA